MHYSRAPNLSAPISSAAERTHSRPVKNKRDRANLMADFVPGDRIALLIRWSSRSNIVSSSDVTMTGERASLIHEGRRLRSRHCRLGFGRFSRQCHLDQSRTHAVYLMWLGRLQKPLASMIAHRPIKPTTTYYPSLPATPTDIAASVSSVSPPQQRVDALLDRSRIASGPKNTAQTGLLRRHPDLARIRE